LLSTLKQVAFFVIIS